MRAFIRDFAAAFLIVAIPILLAGWIVSLLPWPEPELGTFAPALMPVYLVYLVPAGLLAYGIRIRSGAIVAGVLASGAALYLWLAVSLFAERATIRGLEQVAAAPPATAGMLILGNGRSCDPLCVQVLATTGYQVAFRDYPGWAIYRRADGDACQQQKAWQTPMLFIAAGYSGMCAIKTTSKAMPDGIVVTEYKLAGNGRRSDDVLLGAPGDGIVEHPWENELAPVKQIAERVPGFIGELYERSVRIDGQDRLVERRFHGRLQSAAELLTFSLAPGPLSIGDDFDRAAFYGAALGVPMSAARRPGQVSLQESLDQLEHMMLTAAAPETDLAGGDRRFALVSQFASLARSAEGDDRALVHDRIQRLLKSDKPVLVHAALVTMGDSKRADPQEAEAALIQLLDSDNPDVVAIAARKADYQFHLADRPEIARRLLEIPFRDALFQRESVLGTPGVSFAAHRPDGGHDDAYRTRAMELVRSAASMIAGHCEVLLTIIADGRDQAAAKRDVLATFLTVKDDTFTACSAVFRAHRSDLFLDEPPTDEQLAVLRDRAGLVRPVALREYWRQFLSSRHARAMSDQQLLAIVRARLLQDQQSHALDKRALTQTQWLYNDLTRE